MKRLMILFLAIALITSCSEPESNVSMSETINVSDIGTSMSDAYDVASDATITLLNLEEGALYGIFPSATSRSISRSINPNLFETEAGSFLYVSDGTSLTIKASDIGLASSGNVRFIKYDTSENRIIDTESDAPIYIKEDGSRVFEEYYQVNLDDLKNEDPSFDKSRVVLIDRSFSRNAHQSTWYGVLDGNTLRASDEDSLNGIIDLSSSSSLSIFSQVRIEGGSTEREILLKTPQPLDKNKETPIHAYTPYEIKGESGEYVLELDISSAFDISSYEFVNSITDGRYSKHNPGWRKDYIFPFSYDKNTKKVLLYLGESSEDYFFYFQMFDKSIKFDEIGKATVRTIKEDEKALINRVDVVDGAEVTIGPSNNYFIPIIFENAENLNELKLRAYIAGSDRYLSIYSTPFQGGRGYAQESLASSAEITLSKSRVLESAVLYNPNEANVTIVLQFSKEKSFPSSNLVTETVIDFKSLDESSNIDDYIYASQDVFQTYLIKGFEEGYLYGFYAVSNSEMLSNTSDIYRLFDHIYIFRPSSFDKTVKMVASNYGSRISFFKFKASNETLFSTATHTPLFTKADSNGESYDYYLHYTKLDTDALDQSSIYVLHKMGGSVSTRINRVLESQGGLTVSYETERHSAENGATLYGMTLFNKSSSEQSETTSEYIAINPTSLSLNEEKEITGPSLLTLNKDSRKIALEAVLSNLRVRDFIDSILFSTSLDGSEEKNIIPFSYDRSKNTLKLYAGEIPDGLSCAIFAKDNIKITAREITAEEESKISYQTLDKDTGKIDFTLTSDDPLKAFIFTSDASYLDGKNFTITSQDSNSYRFWYKAGGRSSRTSFKVSREYNIDSDRIPEFLSIWTEDEQLSEANFSINIDA